MGSLKTVDDYKQRLEYMISELGFELYHYLLPKFILPKYKLYVNLRVYLFHSGGIFHLGPCRLAYNIRL